MTTPHPFAFSLSPTHAPPSTPGHTPLKHCLHPPHALLLLIIICHLVDFPTFPGNHVAFSQMLCVRQWVKGSSFHKG